MRAGILDPESGDAGWILVHQVIDLRKTPDALPQEPSTWIAIHDGDSRPPVLQAMLQILRNRFQTRIHAIAEQTERQQKQNARKHGQDHPRLLECQPSCQTTPHPGADKRGGRNTEHGLPHSRQG